MGLDFAITDLRGSSVAYLVNRHEGSEVAVPLNGVRSATAVIPISDEAAEEIKPLERRMKVWLDGQIIFNGPLTLPIFSGESQTVMVNALDPGYQLQRSYVQVPALWTPTPEGAVYGLNAPLRDQGIIVKMLVMHPACAAPAAWAPNAPQHGILPGSIPPTRIRDRFYEVGKQIWEAVEQLTEVIDGPDVELQPVDREDGVACLLNVYDHQGQDRSETVVFEFGTGRINCRAVNWEPDGTQVVNRFTSVGQAEEGQRPPIRTSVQDGSVSRFGTWEGFEGRPDISTQVTVTEHADLAVSQGASPPDLVQVVPAVEGIDEQLSIPPKLQEDYWIGDTVGIVAQLGDKSLDLKARVTTATVREVDAAGNIEVALELRPRTFGAGVSAGFWISSPELGY